jgi:hypothetical protein
MEVLNAEDEEGVFSRVQTRGGSAAGEQRSTADAGGDRGGDFAVDVAELAGSVSRWDEEFESNDVDRLAAAVASGPGIGDHAVEA